MAVEHTTAGTKRRISGGDFDTWIFLLVLLHVHNLGFVGLVYDDNTRSIMSYLLLWIYTGAMVKGTIYDDDDLTVVSIFNIQ